MTLTNGYSSLWHKTGAKIPFEFFLSISHEYAFLSYNSAFDLYVFYDCYELVCEKCSVTVPDSW